MTLRKALDRGIVESASADLCGRRHGRHRRRRRCRFCAMKSVFAQLRGRVDGKVVTDMASTKASVMEWASASGIDLVGGHPMCGKEAIGNRRGRSLDVQGRSLGADARATRPSSDLVESVGAHPMVMDAATHDRLVAGVSHAAFLLSVGYVLSLSRPAGLARGLEARGVGVSRHEPPRRRRPGAVRGHLAHQPRQPGRAARRDQRRRSRSCAATSRTTTRAWSSCSKRRDRCANAGPKRLRDRNSSQSGAARG